MFYENHGLPLCAMSLSRHEAASEDEHARERKPLSLSLISFPLTLHVHKTAGSTVRSKITICTNATYLIIEPDFADFFLQCQQLKSQGERHPHAAAVGCKATRVSNT